MLLAIRTLEDGWYVVINAYKLTVFEIWRDLNVLSYIACPRYPYIRVYRLYDRLKPRRDVDSVAAADALATGIVLFFNTSMSSSMGQ